MWLNMMTTKMTVAMVSTTATMTAEDGDGS
jgi:hypothetical protein